MIQRSHYDHPNILDAIAIFGVIDDQLSVHYCDSRGVHRIFTLSFGDGTLRYARGIVGQPAASPSDGSYDWSRTHAHRRGGEALKRLSTDDWPSAGVVTAVYGSGQAARGVAADQVIQAGDGNRRSRERRS